MSVGWEVHSCAWSPDGRWIASSQVTAVHQLQRPGNFAPSIWIAPAAGGASVRVTDDQFLNQSRGLGGSLVYLSSRDGGRDAYEVNLTFGGARGAP